MTLKLPFVIPQKKILIPLQIELSRCFEIAKLNGVVKDFFSIEALIVITVGGFDKNH